MLDAATMAVPLYTDDDASASQRRRSVRFRRVGVEAARTGDLASRYGKPLCSRFSSATGALPLRTGRGYFAARTDPRA
jgi:hypothetical protein